MIAWSRSALSGSPIRVRLRRKLHVHSPRLDAAGKTIHDLTRVGNTEGIKDKKKRMQRIDERMKNRQARGSILPLRLEAAAGCLRGSKLSGARARRRPKEG